MPFGSPGERVHALRPCPKRSGRWHHTLTATDSGASKRWHQREERESRGHANHDVNLAYSNPSKQIYVSVRGTARIDRDRATIDALWSPVQNVFFPQGKEDPDLVVLRVRVRDAAYWESAGNFIARALDFAQGMLSREPRDLGKSGTLSGAP